jgi:hypothetical protein
MFPRPSWLDATGKARGAAEDLTNARPAPSPSFRLRGWFPRSRDLPINGAPSRLRTVPTALAQTDTVSAFDINQSNNVLTAGRLCSCCV